jgi:hypothetical protein
MKIYEEIRIDIETGAVIEARGSDYNGPTAECKGGSTTTNTVDEVYNARMADIAEKQQEMAEKYYSFWEETYKPYETAQVAANTELMPLEVETEQSKLRVQQKEHSLAQAALDDKIRGIELKKPVKEEYFQQALKGPNVGEAMDAAEADVKHSFDKSQRMALRDISRMGLSPEGGQLANAIKDSSLERAKAVAGARTTARRATLDQAFVRLSDAMKQAA